MTCVEHSCADLLPTPWIFFMRLLPSVVLQIQIKGLSMCIGRAGKLWLGGFDDVSERQMTVPSIRVVGLSPWLTGDVTAKRKKIIVLNV